MTTINVTAEMIADGVAKDCFRCPLALGFSAEFGGRWEVGFTYARRVDDAGNAIGEAVTLPPEASAFISEFDSRGTAEPISFEVVS